MRILVLNQYFHPDQSATSQLLTELCEDLAEHHRVTVVTGRPSYNPTEQTASRGLVSWEAHGRVRVARVWSTSFDRSDMARRLTNYATYLASSVAGAVAAGRPDVVVALTDPPPVGLIGALAARARGVPFVLVTKDVFPDVAIALGRLRNPAVIRALRAESAFLLRSAAAVVSIGRDMSARLAALGVPPSKIELIHDWADGARLRPLDGPSPLRIELGWGDRFVVMHSGNVGLSQDLFTVVRAAEALRDQDDVVFAIVGEGAAKAGLQAEVRRLGLGNVEFLPYQPKERLSESLGAADVHLVGLARGVTGFIVPSKVYGILAAGRPYIAAVEEEAEPARIVAEHGCGVRVEPGDPAALAAAILDLREHPDRATAMGAAGRRALEQRFDRPIAAAAYRALLEAVAGRRPGRADRLPWGHAS